MDDEEKNVELRLRGIERSVRVFCAALVLVVGGVTLRMVLMVPKFQQIFKDMLGSEDRFPVFTKFVITLAAYPVVFVGVPFAIMSLGVVAAVKVPRYGWLVIYTSCVGVLVMMWFALARALYLPMVKIIQGVAGYN